MFYLRCPSEGRGERGKVEHVLALLDRVDLARRQHACRNPHTRKQFHCFSYACTGPGLSTTVEGHYQRTAPLAHNEEQME